MTSRSDPLGNTQHDLVPEIFERVDDAEFACAGLNARPFLGHAGSADDSAGNEGAAMLCVVYAVPVVTVRDVRWHIDDFHLSYMASQYASQ